MYVHPPSFWVPYKRNPISEEMKKAAIEYLDKGETLSNRLEECLWFEKELARYLGKKYAVSLNSGTTSMYLAMVGLGVTQGDEVIIPPNTFATVSNSVILTGAKPVFSDVEYDTLNLDPSKIKEKITKKTKAIMPVHTAGNPCDMDPILEIAEEHDLLVIDNATSALGAKCRNKKLPVGDVGLFCFSVKGLWLPGGGGAIVTDNEELVNDVKIRRYGGFSEGGGSSDESNAISLNYKMSDINAAIGRVQLKHLDEYIHLQREHSKMYTKLINELNVPVKTPVEKENAYNVFLRYIIKAPKRDQLREFLRQEGIESHVLYKTAGYLQPLIKEKYGFKPGAFPVTDKLKTEELSLPEPRGRTEEEIEYVVNKMKEFYK